MSTNKVMNAPNLNLNGLIHDLVTWFEAQKFEVQKSDSPGGACLLQCRERESWRTYVGMSTAMNVDLRYQNPRLTVAIGEGKWMDKALIGTFGLLVATPLAIPAAIGAWKQKKLPQRTFDRIQQLLFRYSANQPLISESHPNAAQEFRTRPGPGRISERNDPIENVRPGPGKSQDEEEEYIKNP